MQIELHEHNDYIHTATGLHRRVDAIKAYNRHVQLSDFFEIIPAPFKAPTMSIFLFFRVTIKPTAQRYAKCNEQAD